MQMADYKGNLLNHLEAVYRPGERALAIELVEALGCAVTDTGFRMHGEDTFLAANVNPDDANGRNNVFYLSQATAQQLAVEDGLRAAAKADAELGRRLDTYRAMLRGQPFNVAHFGLKYASSDAVREVARRFAKASPALQGRVHLKVFEPGEEGSVAKNVQGFLHQDVIVSGSFLYGQLIELQAQDRG
jgi:hypothetical protein